MKDYRLPENEQEETIRGLQQKVAAKIVEREDYLNAIELGFDPNECEDSHLPGDCPLCGAN